jgi:lysophospholipase L1-like esterase
MSNFIGNIVTDSDGLVVSSHICLNKYYALSERSIIYQCKFESDTVAKFYTVTSPSSESTKTTTLYVDISNKRIRLNDEEWITCNILNSNDIFYIKITQYYLSVIISIKNSVSKELFSHTYTNDGTGGSGVGAIRSPKYTTGNQHDYYAFGLNSGTAYHIKSIRVITRKVDLVIYGDSITEPEGYWPKDIFNQAWTQLLKSMLNNNMITSGRGGTTINEINSRISNELPFIMPKYCMVTIGTNGGNTASNLTSLVRYIKGLGIIPILNNIPCYYHNGDATSHTSVNTTISSVRTAENVNGCRFNIATSINNDGSTTDTSMFWEEHPSSGGTYYHHPNISGSAAMLLQLQEDVPEIFPSLE